MLSPQQIDDANKQHMLKMLADGKRPVVVGYPLDNNTFDDNKPVPCWVCGISVYVRAWLLELIPQYKLKVVCLLCANAMDPNLLRGTFIQQTVRLGLAEEPGDAAQT